MSESTPTAQESAVTTEGSTADPVETFVATVTDAVAECGATDDTLAAVEEAGAAVVDHVEQLRDELESVRDELADAKDHAARERAELSSRVSEVEESVEESPDDGGTTDSSAANPRGETAESTTDASPQEPRTPLGDCITLPEPIAETELTANVKRARDVAADVVDYGRSVPAGYAITSSELRTVLTALKDGGGKAYTETVRRVMDYLEELGGDCVDVKTTMGGERTVVFSDEFVRRTVAWRNQSGNAVVTEQEATG